MAEEQTSVPYEQGHLYSLRIADILPNPDQPRKYFDQEGMDELTLSVKEKGVLIPILVYLDESDRIILVAGERRIMAAEAAGLTEIPAVFIEDNPVEVSLIENALRQNLTAVEEAEAVGRMATKLNYTQAQVCKVLGKKQQTVSDILSLNRLPAEIRDECRCNPVVTRRVLVEIARKKQDRAMITLYNKYKEKGLTSDELRQAAKREKVEKTPEDQAADLLTGIAALNNRLEKIDWPAVSTDSRSQIQEAFTALTDIFTATINKPKAVA